MRAVIILIIALPRVAAMNGEKRVLAQFKSEDGVLIGTPFDLPLEVNRDSLSVLCNAVLENVS